MKLCGLKKSITLHVCFCLGITGVTNKSLHFLEISTNDVERIITDVGNTAKI